MQPLKVRTEGRSHPFGSSRSSRQFLSFSLQFNFSLSHFKHINLPTSSPHSPNLSPSKFSMTIKSPQFNLLFFIGLVLLLSPAAAQTSPDPNDYNYGNNISSSIGVVIIVLVVFLFLLGFFSMYIRHCAGDYSATDAANRLSAAQAGRSRIAPRGLDTTVIQSFPTFDYSSIKSLQIGKSALECAVCLNEFEDDEMLRLIPKCDHVFHPDCIDVWLVSHTTCPVCRADLTPQPDESLHAPQLGQITEFHQDQDNEQPSSSSDVVIDVVGQPVSPPTECESEVMERPLNPAALPPPVPRLNRSRTRRNASGRPRWFGMFARSNSTGHVAVKQWENMERFTLRLPDEVRRQIISGKLNRTTSCVALPREGSSRRGPRDGPPGPVGEGSSRGRLFGTLRSDRAERSDRWVFSLAPPFFSRAPSVRSPKVAAAGGDGGSVKSSKAADSVHVSKVSEPNLPPV